MRRCALLRRMSPVLALSGHSKASVRMSAFGAKRTCAVVWFRAPRSLMTHLCHSTINFAVMHSSVPPQRCGNVRHPHTLGRESMKRREFITLLGCAVAVEPHAADAQQVSKTAKVGLLYPGMAAALPSRVAGLRDGLQTAGY